MRAPPCVCSVPVLHSYQPAKNVFFICRRYCYIANWVYCDYYAVGMLQSISRLSVILYHGVTYNIALSWWNKLMLQVNYWISCGIIKQNVRKFFQFKNECLCASFGRTCIKGKTYNITNDYTSEEWYYSVTFFEVTLTGSVSCAYAGGSSGGWIHRPCLTEYIPAIEFAVGAQPYLGEEHCPLCLLKEP